MEKMNMDVSKKEKKQEERVGHGCGSHGRHFDYELLKGFAFCIENAWKMHI
jgi:hypothetical protein